MTSALCETVVGGVRKLAAAETTEDGGELRDTQSYRLCTEAVDGVTGLPGGWPGADRQQPDGECNMARGDRGIGRVAPPALANKGHKVCIGIRYREREDCAHEVVEKIRHFGSTAIAMGGATSQSQNRRRPIVSFNLRYAPAWGATAFLQRQRQSTEEPYSAPTH